MDLKEICLNMRNWINSAEDRDYWRDLVNVAGYLVMSRTSFNK